MKKVLLTLLLGLFMVFVFNYCDKEDPKPQCEIDEVGTVTAKNATGYKLWVDVTWGDVVVNYEKQLNNGASYKYSNIPAGSIEVWGSFDKYDWTYEIHALSICEDMEFTWQLSNQKSTETMIELVNDQTGEIVKTLTIKNKSKY